MMKMDNDSFYRPTGRVKDTNRTYVPDLYRQVAEEIHAEEEHWAQDKASAKVIELQSRPLVGVMYSISAGVEGELFPIYIGRNIIGSDTSCDICLRERTISPQHALLLTRMQTNEDGEQSLHVMLSDNCSAGGTSVNGEPVIDERAICVDGDIITIGLNYVLVLSLFHALGRLSVSCDFERMPVATNEEETEMSPSSAPPVEQPSMSETVSAQSGMNTLEEKNDDAVSDFYRPTRHHPNDHYNNKTIII